MILNFFVRIMNSITYRDMTIDAEDNYNLLFIGPPANAKTLFLLGILESRKGVYFDGSNTTNRILDVLEQKKPEIICMDELDKMPRSYLISWRVDTSR